METIVLDPGEDVKYDFEPTKVICRCCLTTEKRMMSVTKFQTFFRDLTGLNVDGSDGLPPWVCFECGALLQKSVRFKNKVLRAHTMLYDYLARCAPFPIEPQDEELLKYSSPNLSTTGVLTIDIIGKGKAGYHQVLEHEKQFNPSGLDDIDIHLLNKIDNEGVKEENNGFSDIEDNITLEEISRTVATKITDDDIQSLLQETGHIDVEIKEEPLHKKSKKNKTKQDKVKKKKKEDKIKPDSKSTPGKSSIRKTIELDPSKIKIITLNPEEQIKQREIIQMDHDYIRKPVANKSRNTKYCCVPQCSTYGDTEISFHLFPKDKIMKNKRKIALRIGKPISPSMRVCSHHFQASNFFPNNSKRQKLYPYVVPSQNIPKRSSDKEVPLAKKIKSIARENRADTRRRKIVESNKELGLAIENEETKFENNNITDNNSPHHVMTSSTQVNLVDYRNYRPREDRSIADILCDKEPLEKCTQINCLPMWEEDRSALKQLTLSDLLSSDMYLFTFTGIHSIELLETLVNCVSELALDAPTNKKMLSVRDRVILTMGKIKQNMSFRAIGVLFGINRQTCSNYFNNMCPMLSRVLKVVIPWPDIEMIRSNLPKSFQKYRNTRIILDCAETVIEKCKCLKCRILTYSQYKKCNTAKFNIGITPSGLITEISASYGGRASDKHIVNKSGILNKCEFDDGVMVDKGYRIESECNERLLQLIRPPFLSQKKQMTKEDAIRTAEIARARVHVERVIQRLRQYKLLCGPLPWSLAPYFDDILIIVGGLTNLGPPIIHIDKFM